MDAGAWDERYAASDLVWSPTPNVWVESLAAPLEPGLALDVAAGEGRNAFWLVGRGWRVVAADFSPVAVARTVALADERLTAAERGRLQVVVADATAPAPEPTFDVEPGPGSGGVSGSGSVVAGSAAGAGGGAGTGGRAAYDLVLFSYLHLPAEQWRRALARGVEAAAPGGRVLVVAHALRNLTEGAGGPQDPSVLLDPEAVVASAAGLGVEVEVELAEVRERAVPGSERPALDTVVLLRRIR